MGTPFIGEIKIISWNFAPKGWTFCNGQLLPINQNQALFSLLGTMYGGDGRTTFGLPYLRSRIPVHLGNGFTQGEKAGEENHTLNQNEMPGHAHAGSATDAAADTDSPNGARFAANDLAMYSDAGPDTSLAATTAAVGGNQAHTNIPPFLVLNFVIALQGIFPSRN